MSAIHLKQDEHFNKRYSWIGIIVVCVLSFPLHFLYEWLGESALVGMFTPVNESIWEHLKLVFWPLLLWWGVGYLVFHDKQNLSLIKWTAAASVSIFISMIFIVSWYYTWVNGLAVESSIIDIGSLFVAVPLGQLLSIHVYRVIQPRRMYLIISIVFVVLMGILFIYFTFAAPDIPIFVPPS
ncbi:MULTISPECIES: DUF6512 family protein [Jeotgalibaca]|uniref:DUF6512 family protein n=1 Tax=Lactobacillales TaxID=186826 RepID=UPI00359F88F8